MVKITRSDWQGRVSCAYFRQPGTQSNAEAYYCGHNSEVRHAWFMRHPSMWVKDKSRQDISVTARHFRKLRYNGVRKPAFDASRLQPRGLKRCKRVCKAGPDRLVIGTRLRNPCKTLNRSIREKIRTKGWRLASDLYLKLTPHLGTINCFIHWNSMKINPFVTEHYYIIYFGRKFLLLLLKSI